MKDNETQQAAPTGAALYWVECNTGDKWVPLDCVPLPEAERMAEFMRRGAQKSSDVRVVPFQGKS